MAQSLSVSSLRDEAIEGSDATARIRSSSSGVRDEETQGIEQLLYAMSPPKNALLLRYPLVFLAVEGFRIVSYTAVSLPFRYLEPLVGGLAMVHPPPRDLHVLRHSHNCCVSQRQDPPHTP